MMNTFVVLAVISLWVAVFLAGPVWLAWRRWRGTRVVTCPENGRPAAVDLDLRYAMAGSILGRPELRLRDCSRWPERKGCGQICLSQVEESPGSCLVRTMLEGWYADKSCAYCARAFGPIHWQNHNPGLRSPEGKLREWSEVPPETLPEVLLTHKPICWNCMIAEGFRQRLPELVVDRPPRPHDGAVTPPAHAVDQRPRA
jgi:hypothetical protein